MIDLTPTQREMLRSWLTDIHDRREHFDYSINLIRVIAGDKPATDVSESDWKDIFSPFDSRQEFIAFIERLGLWYRLNGDLHTIGNSSWRLELLPTSTRYRHSDGLHRRLGVVFGYPQEDVEWFIRGEPRTSPHDRVENGAFTPEEMAYIDFLPYKNEDSIEGFDRAIEEGKRIRELLSDVAAAWELPIIDRIAEERYRLSVEVYSGERKGFLFQTTEFEIEALGN